MPGMNLQDTNLKALPGTPNNAMLHAAQALRYQVYCHEAHFLNPDDYPDGIEHDNYDEHSCHFVVARGVGGDVVATMRLVLPECDTFPLDEHCIVTPEKLAGIPRNKLAEISRLAMSKKYRRDISRYDTQQDRRKSSQDPGNSFDANLIFELYRLMYQQSKRSGIEYWLAAMGRPLERLLSRCSLKFTQIGPEVDYYGPVTPYLGVIADIEKHLAQANPRLFSNMLRGLEAEYIPACAESVLIDAA